MTGATRSETAVIERLALPADERDVRELAQLLVDAVDAGAAVSFLAPLSLERAEAWWRAALASSPPPLVLVARQGREIVGTVQLRPAWAPNQPHRGDVAKLIVHRKCRRSGLGERLMRALDELAAGAGLTLLTLDAKAGGDGERLYRRRGWTCAGTIPDYALDTDGKTLHATVVFWKRASASAGPRAD